MRKIRVYGEPTWVPGSVQGMPSPDGGFVRFGRVLGGNLGPNGRRSGARVPGFASPCAPFPAATPRHRVKTGMRASSARKGWEHVKAGAMKNERVGGGTGHLMGPVTKWWRLAVPQCGPRLAAVKLPCQARRPAPPVLGQIRVFIETIWSRPVLSRTKSIARGAVIGQRPRLQQNPLKRCF